MLLVDVVCYGIASILSGVFIVNAWEVAGAISDAFKGDCKSCNKTTNTTAEVHAYLYDRAGAPSVPAYDESDERFLGQIRPLSEPKKAQTLEELAKADPPAQIFFKEVPPEAKLEKTENDEQVKPQQRRQVHVQAPKKAKHVQIKQEPINIDE